MKKQYGIFGAALFCTVLFSILSAPAQGAAQGATHVPGTGTIGVTASSGTLGRLVAAELKRRGQMNNTILTARNPAKIADLAASGFKTARADYDDAASMEAAFKGVEVLLFISGEGNHEERAAAHKRVIDAAKKAGVERIVYTSFTNPTAQSRFPLAHSHGLTEDYLKASANSFTILRNNLYAWNLDPILEQSKEADLLQRPAARGKVAYVTHEDCAAAAVGALLGAGHANKIYEITGPEAADLYEIAAALSQARGRKVTAVDAPMASFESMFRSSGLPDYMVVALLGLLSGVGAGEYEAVSQDGPRLAGRPFTPIREYVRRFAR